MTASSETQGLLAQAEPLRKSLDEMMDEKSHENSEPEQLDLPVEEVDAEEEKASVSPVLQQDLKPGAPASRKAAVMKFFMSNMIVLFATALVVYENVLKPKANAVMTFGSWAPKGDGKIGDKFTSDYAFEFASISLMSAILSIVVGFALAAYNGTIGSIFTKEHAKMCLWFQPAAAGFAASQFINFFNLKYLDSDTLKVFDQSRLLITALVMMVLLKKTYSRSSWTSLVVITLSAIMYGLVKPASGGGNQNMALGGALVLLNACVTALAGVWAEKFMKAYKSTPFYIQKIYLELGNVVFQSLFIFVINPLMEEGKPSNSNKYGYNPFHGWFSNMYVLPLFTVFFVKSYLQGILVKQMSSLVKQLSQVVATALVYFFLLIHHSGCEVKDAKDVIKMVEGKTFTSADERNTFLGAENVTKLRSTVTDFFCMRRYPEFPVVLADVLVVVSVVAYILANRDKARKQMYRKQRDEFEEQIMGKSV